MLYLLGTVKESDKVVHGYVIYNYAGKEDKVSVVTVNELGTLAGKEIVNAKVKKGAHGLELESTNGDIKRYPSISTRGQVIKNSVVVLSRVESGNQSGFRVVNISGKKTILRDKEAVAYAKMVGVANGKVTTISGTETIACISGHYPVEVIEKKAPVADKKESKYSEDFYKELERAFGVARTNVLRYLLEKKGMPIEGVIESMNQSKVGIALAGLIVYTIDVHNLDMELREILKGVVDSDGLKVVDYMARLGLSIGDYWDCPIVLNQLENSKKDLDITRWKLANCVGNYIAAKKPNGIELKSDYLAVAGEETDLKNNFVIGVFPEKNIVATGKFKEDGTTVTPTGFIVVKDMNKLQK